MFPWRSVAEAVADVVGHVVRQPGGEAAELSVDQGVDGPDIVLKDSADAVGEAVVHGSIRDDVEVSAKHPFASDGNPRI